MTGTPVQAPAQSPLAQPHPWNLVANGYDEYTREYLGNFFERALERIDLKKDARVVDVACGPGTGSLLLAERVRHIDAVDFSADMLAKFREHLGRQSLSHITLHEADGQELPLEDNAYDFGFSMFGLMFFPDRVRGMKELFRVLKPGGQVVIGSWAPAARSPLMNQMLAMVRALDPTIPDPVPDLANHENPEVLRAELEAAGFSQVRVEEIECPMHISDIDEFWKGMEKGAVPIVMMKKRFSEEEWRERVQAGLAQLRASLRTPCSLSSKAHVGFGLKA